jgi:hypothetical protein
MPVVAFLRGLILGGTLVLALRQKRRRGATTFDERMIARVKVLYRPSNTDSSRKNLDIGY